MPGASAPPSFARGNDSQATGLGCSNNSLPRYLQQERQLGVAVRHVARAVVLLALQQLRRHAPQRRQGLVDVARLLEVLARRIGATVRAACDTLAAYTPDKCTQSLSGIERRAAATLVQLQCGCHGGTCQTTSWARTGIWASTMNGVSSTTWASIVVEPLVTPYPPGPPG